MTTLNETLTALLGTHSASDINNELHNIQQRLNRIAELTAQRDSITAELDTLTGAQHTTAIEDIAHLDSTIEIARSDLARLVSISSGRARGMTIGIEIEFKVHSEDYRDTARRTFRDCFNERFGSAIIGSDVRGYPHNHNKYATKWKITGDGSLTRRGDLEPMELISPILKGERGLMQAVEVMNTIADCGGQIDKQCSVHVHFGVERMSTASIKRIVETYVNNQELIATALPRSRRDSEWARYMPLTSAHTSNWGGRRINLSDVLENDNDTPFSTICNRLGGSSEPYPSYRYYACNVVSAYEKHKTVEFRAHGGTTEGVKLEYWVRFLHLIVKSAETTRTDTTSAFSNFHDLCGALSDKTDLTLSHADTNGNSPWAQMVNAIKTGTDNNTTQSPYRSRAKAQLAGKAIADYMQERADILELQGR